MNDQELSPAMKNYYKNKEKFQKYQLDLYYKNKEKINQRRREIYGSNKPMYKPYGERKSKHLIIKRGEFNISMN